MKTILGPHLAINGSKTLKIIRVEKEEKGEIITRFVKARLNGVVI